MTLFLRSNSAESGQMLYYKALHSYLQDKSAEFPDSQIEKMLTENYDETVVKRILEDVGVPEKIFERAILPSCFDCKNCKIESFCRYFTLIRKVKAFQRIQQSNVPNQLKLAKIFNNINTEQI